MDALILDCNYLFTLNTASHFPKQVAQSSASGRARPLPRRARTRGPSFRRTPTSPPWSSPNCRGRTRRPFLNYLEGTEDRKSEAWNDFQGTWKLPSQPLLFDVSLEMKDEDEMKRWMRIRE